MSTTPQTKERHDLVSFAKQAQQSNQYVDMMNIMEQLAQHVANYNVELTGEERDLLLTAYKLNIGPLRVTLYREEASLQQKEIARQLLFEACHRVLNFIDSTLLPRTSEFVETHMFYWTMKGDHNRYLAEVFKGDNVGNQAIQNANTAYNLVWQILDGNVVNRALPSVLHYWLSASVYRHEILDEPVKAREMAQQALELAYPELETLDEVSFDVSKRLMNLLKTNLNLWTDDLTPELRNRLTRYRAL